ncbi:UNVERIFIED_CONTAM: hypothetical protein FKN15_039127 [Acipenser sinensis]
MQNTRPMSGKSGFHPCTACNANIPQEDKHTLCAQCLGIQHATLALERDVACSICEAFQLLVKEALWRGPQGWALRPLWPDHQRILEDSLLGIPDGQAVHSHSPFLQARRVKLSKQTRDIMDLKAHMAQEEVSLLAQEDTFSIASSGEGASFSSDKHVGETPAEEEPGFEVASEAIAAPPPSPLSSSVSALMGRAAALLQVAWMPAAEPRRSVFRTQTMAPHPQKFLDFPDFMEDVGSSRERLASGPSVLKNRPHRLPP